MSNEQIIEKVGKGWVQKRFLEDLLKFGETSEFRQYATSQAYFGKYARGFLNAISRLERETGIKVEIIMGSRGGYWTAHAKIVS